jgi:plastocyanin
MSRRLALALILALVPLFAGWHVRTPLQTSVARAADTWNVQVSLDLKDEAKDEAFVVNAFLPSALTIHRGDTVAWKWASEVPHTVTFLSGQPAPPLFVPGPTAGELAAGPAFFPAGPTGPNVAYDGTQLVGTGVPAAEEGGFSFRLTFTRAGVYPYVCLTHPGMNGSVQVLEGDAPLAETPAQAQARGQAQSDALVTQLRADVKTVQSTRLASAGGPSIHTNALGISSLIGPGNAGGASALQFLPTTLTVRRGDRVVWTLADPLEVHTVTFTSGAPTPDFLEVRPQAGGQPLLVIPAPVAGPAGGTTYTGQGYLNSGIVSIGNAVIFTVDAPPGTYEYLCLIHWPQGMKAKLVVTE